MFMFQRHLEGPGVRLCILAFALVAGFPVGGARAEPTHAIAMHGKPAMPADFTHMPYANPDARKGGRLVWGILGTFDSLNPFIVKGLAVQPIRNYGVEGPLGRGQDEGFTLYGLLARTVEAGGGRSFVTFRLDPRPRFSHGKPGLGEDVLVSWQLLR